MQPASADDIGAASVVASLLSQPPLHAVLGSAAPEHNPLVTNELVIRQQPNRARMCGFGTKDYRPVDPAPILQLIRKENNQITLEYVRNLTIGICIIADHKNLANR
ncbi:hypothetical protein HKX48_008345 [Thoreauomyces humboldtii]|nr:hypothetical protein HKX48_008345 [Thoreauomyces humboldtii]